MVVAAGGVAFSFAFLLLALPSLFLPKARRAWEGMAAFAELTYDELRSGNMPTSGELRCRICGRLLRYRPGLAGHIYSHLTTLSATVVSLAVVCLLVVVVRSAADLLTLWRR